MLPTSSDDPSETITSRALSTSDSPRPPPLEPTPARPFLLSIGQQTVTGYFLIAYFLPLLGNALFADSIVSTYIISPLTIYSVSLLLIAYLLFLLLSTAGIPSSILPWTSALHPFAYVTGQLYARIRLPIAALAAPLAVSSLLTGTISYRYANEGISEVNSPLLLLLIIIRIVISIDLFYCMFVSRREAIKVPSIRYFENMLLAITLVLSANGTADTFLTLAALFYAVFPGVFKRLVFMPKSAAGSAAWLIVSFIVVPCLGMSAWMWGESIKASSASIGQSEAIAVFTSFTQLTQLVFSNPEFLTNYFYYLIERLSIYYYSFLFTVESTREILNRGELSVLVYPIRTLLFRIDYITGGLFGAQRPNIGSIMQWNYLILTIGETTSRQGSSPGVLAAFNYVFSHPLGPLLCAFYLSWVSKLIDTLFRSSPCEVLSPFSMSWLFIFLGSFFQSPFDWLAVIDDGTIFLLLVFGLAIGQETDTVSESIAKVPTTDSTSGMALERQGL